MIIFSPHKPFVLYISKLTHHNTALDFISRKLNLQFPEVIQICYS